MPDIVLEFVNDTMQAAYPPTSHKKTKYLWAVRAMMDVVAACDEEHVQSLILSLLEGIVTCVEDESMVWTLEELEYDVSLTLHFRIYSLTRITCLV